MKSLIRYIDEGLLIPTEVLKELGSDISVQKYSNVIVIEARERAYARKKLTAMVQKLRSYGDTLEPLCLSSYE